MKKSFLIVISLIMACLMVLTACRDTSSSKPQDRDESSSASQAESYTEENTLSSSESEVTAEKESESELEKETTEAELESDTEADLESDTENNDSDVTTEGEEEKPSALVDNIPASKSYKGILYYKTTDGKDKAFNIGFSMDYKALIDGDNEEYSEELSKLAILCASDVYDDFYVELTEGAVGGNDEPTTFGSLLGLQDVKSYDINPDDYTVDKDDVTQFVVGHKNVVHNGVAREIIIVSVRGTNSTNAEWSSNFDVGADTEEYYSMMGAEHPDWKNKSNHKGFDVAANRAYGKLLAYIDAYVNPDAQASILVTGHSRGGAIANILCQMLEKSDSYRTYGYTFAAPNTTTASDAGSYKTIFNIKNDDDIITYLPLSEWGFTNYGTVKSVSVDEQYGTGFLESASEGSFKWFTGESYNDDGGTERTLECFAALASTREDLYKLDSSDDGKARENILGHITYAGAEEELNELKTTLEGEKLLRFCNVYIVDTLVGYHVEINYCPAYFMQMLSNMTTEVGPIAGRALSGKYNSAKISFALSSGKLVLGGMEHPHMPPTYYLIAENNFLPLERN